MIVSCEICQRPSSVHVTEIECGCPVDHHFCDQHAEEYLGRDFRGDVISPFNLSSLSPRAYARLADAMAEAELEIVNPTSAADLVPAVPGLIGLLDDEEACLRYFAATWLGSIGSAKALSALRATTDDCNSYVRDAAFKAIEKIQRM